MSKIKIRNGMYPERKRVPCIYKNKLGEVLSKKDRLKLDDIKYQILWRSNKKCYLNTRKHRIASKPEYNHRVKDNGLAKYHHISKTERGAKRILNTLNK